MTGLYGSKCGSRQKHFCNFAYLLSFHLLSLCSSLSQAHLSLSVSLPLSLSLGRTICSVCQSFYRPRLILQQTKQPHTMQSTSNSIDCVPADPSIIVVVHFVCLSVCMLLPPPSKSRPASQPASSERSWPGFWHLWCPAIQFCFGSVSCQMIGSLRRSAELSAVYTHLAPMYS